MEVEPLKRITKKRLAAICIDLGISTAVTLTAEYFLRKKIKSEAFHNLVTPTVVFWGLEYAQLRKSGQTMGYKAMGLTLENEDGTPLTDKQIMKRMAYRDTISTFHYLKDREQFEGENGECFPHDRISQTVVKEN